MLLKQLLKNLLFPLEGLLNCICTHVSINENVFTGSYLWVRVIFQGLFLVTLSFVHVAWWKDFTTLAICVFSLPFFLNTKSSIFAVGFFEKPCGLIKIQNDLLLQKKQIALNSAYNKNKTYKTFTIDSEMCSILIF